MIYTLTVTFKDGDRITTRNSCAIYNIDSSQKEAYETIQRYATEEISYMFAEGIKNFSISLQHEDESNQ